MNKSKLYFLIVILVVVITSITITSYAYLTDMGSSSLIFQVDRLNIDVNVEGNVIVNNVVTEDLNNLAYVHIKDDVLLDKYTMFGNMKSELKISVTCNNRINTRPHVSVPSVDGLLFFVINDSNPSSNINVKTENGIIKYQYVDGTWNDVIDLTTYLNSNEGSPFTTLDTNIRSAFNNYNQSFFESLYLNTLLGPTDSLNLRLIVWGDYYNLTGNDLINYLSKVYNMTLNIRIIQAIDEYGGTLNYEQD